MEKGRKESGFWDWSFNFFLAVESLIVFPQFYYRRWGYFESGKDEVDKWRRSCIVRDIGLGRDYG